MSAVSLLESGEQRHIKAINNILTTGIVLERDVVIVTLANTLLTSSIVIITRRVQFLCICIGRCLAGTCHLPVQRICKTGFWTPRGSKPAIPCPQLNTHLCELRVVVNVPDIRAHDAEQNNVWYM